MLVQRAGLDRGAQILVQQLGFPAHVAEHRQTVHRGQQRQAVDIGGHRDRIEVVADDSLYDRAGRSFGGMTVVKPALRGGVDLFSQAGRLALDEVGARLVLRDAQHRAGLAGGEVPVAQGVPLRAALCAIVRDAVGDGDLHCAASVLS